jgi:hypothetical protein
MTDILPLADFVTLVAALLTLKVNRGRNNVQVVLGAFEK